MRLFLKSDQGPFLPLNYCNFGEDRFCFCKTQKCLCVHPYVHEPCPLSSSRPHPWHQKSLGNFSATQCSLQPTWMTAWGVWPRLLQLQQFIRWFWCTVKALCGYFLYTKKFRREKDAFYTFSRYILLVHGDENVGEWSHLVLTSGIPFPLTRSSLTMLFLKLHVGETLTKMLAKSNLPTTPMTTGLPRNVCGGSRCPMGFMWDSSSKHLRWAQLGCLPEDVNDKLVFILHSIKKGFQFLGWKWEPKRQC